MQLAKKQNKKYIYIYILMCGITVFLSKMDENVIVQILKSLSLIQNRGYDSVGISMKTLENKWEIYKHASEEESDSLCKLTETMNNKKSHIAIGHTRWATHGGKTDENSHPHISMHKNIILVHNGIINNFQEIKNFLKNKGYIFYSETDTEVIANLIEYYLLKNDSINSAIELASKDLNGTWALAIIYTLESDKVFLTRHGSPLILGYNDNVMICTSEISGFIGLVNNYIIIENNDIITITKDGYTSNHIYDNKKIENIVYSDSPEPFLHWTIKEIFEQPKSILAAYNNGARIHNNEIMLGGLTILSEIINTTSRPIEHVVLLGCGTSLHACILAKLYFGKSNIFSTVQALDASEFSSKDLPTKGQILCILCSQSGETRDLVKALDICKKQNCVTLGVINSVDSLLAKSVDCGVYLNAGPEIAVASTKSFTSTLIILSLIGMWFNEKYVNIPIINSLRILPKYVEEMLVDKRIKNSCENIVKFITTQEIHSIFILGREKMFPIAREIALKMKEITYIHAEGYAAGSLKHGPFALLDSKALVILLIDENNVNNLTSTFHEISARDTNCCIVSDYGLDYINTHLKLELPNISHYQEIIFSIALQYLSYLLSISRNINPDKPRNLAKVVTVE
jgi:glucosamine--fructose-6-phosphate aminotransferase (isomerizing)